MIENKVIHNIPLKNKHDIEVATEKLTTLLQTAATESIQYQIKENEIRYRASIVELIEQRRKIRRQ